MRGEGRTYQEQLAAVEQQTAILLPRQRSVVRYKERVLLSSLLLIVAVGSILFVSEHFFDKILLIGIRA